ncbi:hypothetical protein KIW84_MT0033 (mitochondrion) [Lathyrus oleraceus]|nr:hypothetical protein KIW84_MT0033 [Pisum sativum]
MNVLPRVGTEPTALVASSSLEQFPSSSLLARPVSLRRLKMRSRDQASSHPLLLVFECWDPIFSRSIGRYLPIDRSHLRKSLRAQLALFVDVTRAGRGIARFDVGAAELPYLTNEA